MVGEGNPEGKPGGLLEPGIIMYRINNRKSFPMEMETIRYIWTISFHLIIAGIFVVIYLLVGKLLTAVLIWLILYVVLILYSFVCFIIRNRV